MLTITTEVKKVALPYHYDVAAPPDAVFELLDDFERFGAHMMHSSWMMAGSRMPYEFDEARGRAPGARVQLAGSLLGMRLYIDEEVVERVPRWHKSWNTVGKPRMLILDSYHMGFSLAPTPAGCRVSVFIEYATPPGGLGRWLGRFIGPFYVRWRVRTVLDGTRLTVQSASGHGTVSIRRTGIY